MPVTDIQPGYAAPVDQSERITILDSLRGIAILGILLMNIPGFALPEPVIYDPSVLNEWGTINFKTWYFIEWFMEGSQRALFSMLFGAGIILFIGRQEKRQPVFTLLIILFVDNYGYWFSVYLMPLFFYGSGIFYFIMPAWV
ncbi:MAG: hypothetical protein WKF59_16425 [Chitinophagaceae bacterium]